MTEMSDRVAVIIDNLRRVFRVVNEQSKKAKKETGLTGPQLWAIKTIAQGAPIMVSERRKLDNVWVRTKKGGGMLLPF
jgi:predicted secreted protein